MTNETYLNNLDNLLGSLAEYLATRNCGVPIAADNLHATYTNSAAYLFYTAIFHRTPDFAAFFTNLIDNYIKPHHAIIDTGCATGFSGLSLLLTHRPKVVFHDYDGLGLDFIRWFVNQNDYQQAGVTPYGETIARADWVLSCDVLEHTGNHLGYLRWLTSLGANVALCYPIVGYEPPYKQVIDEWVDDAVIQQVIADRHEVLETYTADGRRYTIYKV